MAVPKYDDLLNPLLQALHNLGGSASVSELEDAVAAILSLSEEDVDEIHKRSATKFGYRLAWARNYLKNYGLLENSSRGIWALTATGSKVTSVDKEEVKRKVRGQYREQKSKQPEDTGDIVEETEQQLAWKEELLEILKNMSASSFENLCKRLLRESGFVNVEVTGRSGDGGIDGKGIVKIGGLLSFHVVFQAKRYKDTVSSSVIRDFRGAMVGRADKGLILSTGTFTRDARIEAQRDGAPPIDLIDGEALVERLKELSIGVRVEHIEHVTINRDRFQNI
jgi:restriction system protein